MGCDRMVHGCCRMGTSDLELAPVKYDHATMSFLTPRGVQRIRLLVPKTVEDRITGLKGVMFLPSNSGMLFDFRGDRAPCLTMKDVRFPLDMLFIDQAGRILSIVRAHPDQEHVIGPLGTRFVVEINGGSAAQHGLRTGQTVRIAQ